MNEFRPCPPTKGQVYSARAVFLGLCVTGAIYHRQLQLIINTTWSYLLSTWVFNCVFFETWWATVCYALLLLVPLLLDKLRCFDKYKLDPGVGWKEWEIKRILLEAVEYCVPLMTLDTFMVKRYWGVDSKEWDIRRIHWVQHTRALPKEPPSLLQLTTQLILSFIIYDALFFTVHLVLHRNVWLYKHIHSTHHDHEAIHSKVTNQLSVPERIVLVLSANEALKIVRAHPLTRTVFVPLFIGWLVENHLGYDLPWTLDKVIPFNLLGGSARHYAHHKHGSRYYQPFFTYFDNFINRRSTQRVKENKD